jgi:hypothetical protein
MVPGTIVIETIFITSDKDFAILPVASDTCAGMILSSLIESGIVVF